MTRLCRKCQRVLPEDADFCPKCGNPASDALIYADKPEHQTSLYSRPEVQQGANPYPNFQQPLNQRSVTQQPVIDQPTVSQNSLWQNDPPQKRSKAPLLAALAIVCCIILVVGILVVRMLDQQSLRMDRDRSEGSDSEVTRSSETMPVEFDPAYWLEFDEGTVLRMATGYNKESMGLFFTEDIAGAGITLADGTTYHAGELKPVWVEVQSELGMIFEDRWTGAGSANKEFEYWQERLNEVDMIVGNASQLSEYGEVGKLVNLADYLDQMPNFATYLEANPIIRMSITANMDTGSIYFAPYSDGLNDLERMPLMRTDWVEKLLDGEGDFTAYKSGTLAAPVYTPYMPTFGKISVDVVSLDGTRVEAITKDYDAAGNIVAKMNAAGSISGVEAVNMLRDYIDAAYNGYYGTTRSNLFIGQNAAWDADELVALLRCIVSNAQTLNGSDTIYGLFSREDNNNQRRVDMFRFCGTLFGVRGLDSRHDYLYIGYDGMLHDARQEAATYEALERMHAMAQEGLIANSFLNMYDESTATMLENDLGFMHYDYNQTQTVFNDVKLNNAAGERYMAVMVPVARWYDGSNYDGVYMRFSESWRSVKIDGWAISAEGVFGDQNKLHAALKLIDYAYSPKGQILLSYGPDAFIKTNADGSYVTFSFNGEQMPVISDATYAELWDKAGGNVTNYARYYLGATLGFAKSQAFEYQCTQEVGQIGAGYISNAIGLGTIKHPEHAITDNPWYTSVPTDLHNTAEESAIMNSYTELWDYFSTFKAGTNILIEQIVYGYTLEGVDSAAEAAACVANNWNGATYLTLKQDAYERLLDLYYRVVY